MKSLSHIATRHLEQVVLVEFLKYASLQFDKLKTDKIKCHFGSVKELTKLLLRTLFDIIIVNNALLFALIATFNVVA